jgi:hypothetical protein
LLKPAIATSTATREVKAGSCAQIGDPTASTKELVPVRTTMSATATSRASPPMKVSSIVRIDAASPAWPERAMSRKDASDVSSQVRNMRIRLSLRTRPTMAKVNAVMIR